MTAETVRTSKPFDELVASRHAVRRFLPDPVEQHLIMDILSVAGQAPSALNTQPWQVHVLMGRTLADLTNAACAAHDAKDFQPECPTEWFGDYEKRRRAFGARFYRQLQIERHEHTRISEQQKNNYRFYGAPIGLIFTIDRRLTKSSWADYGMFLQTLMLAAKARGLDTCPQGCWCNFPHIIRPRLGLSTNDTIVCGMALGYADLTAVEYQTPLDRMMINEFTTFHGKEELNEPPYYKEV